MVQRFSIFEKAVESKHRRKMASIQEQADFVAEIDARARSMSPSALAPEFEAELAEVADLIGELPVVGAVGANLARSVVVGI